MDITLAHVQIFNDYLCALSLYLSFLFVFLLFICSFEGLRIFKFQQVTNYLLIAHF